MTPSKGIFTISLDFELYWGVRDKRSVEAYKNNLLGVSKAIPELLTIFESKGIHASWATLGFLFFKNVEELKQYLPESIPDYQNKNLSPYLNLEELAKIDPVYLFAPGLIEKIKQTPGQELATHTFSHYYCLESGQSKEDFYHDLKTSKKIAELNGISLQSLVFPRNQWKEEYLSVLNNLDIKCYRGNEKSWMYRASANQNQSQVMRAFRLLDAYLNISGHNVYNISECIAQRPFNFPSSRFLRPYSKKLSFWDGLKLKRIKNSMTHAAKNKKLFHLWWHPHNFGMNTTQNFDFLNKIIVHYQKLYEQYGMVSMNMRELSDLNTQYPTKNKE